MALQSRIARALDVNKLVLLSRLDLSLASNTVIINLLLKRLKINGLPSDVTSLIEIWLRNGYNYVSLNYSNSTLFKLLIGTVQGSLLGQVLYTMFVLPLFKQKIYWLGLR